MINRKLYGNILLPLFSTALLAGCVTFSNIPSGKEIVLGPDEGLVIIGGPVDVRLVFHSGDKEDGKFYSDTYKLPSGIVGKPENGYLIRKLKVTEQSRGYGLFRIVADQAYAANCTQALPVFDVKAGQIQYYGDFHLSKELSGININFDNNFEAAKAHFASLYPKNTIAITNANMQFFQQGRCTQGGGIVYIPIYRK
ncbi:hypothetical protein PQR63_08425 [Herbaspirillum rhizosphaerae]|uniref:Lipoprotein n=1 Tax=Herbaspirillum rhizosphaerae TaxID=346179 RepID=A0ABW8Z7X8_9BURK